MNQEQTKSILLFDGVCNFCNSSVTFVLKRDKKKKIFFASLQSDCAKKLLEDLDEKIPAGDYESVLFIRDGKLYKKSEAVLEILNQLGGLWKVFYLFHIIPSFISNFLYDLIAQNRYRIFGKKESCMVPTPEIKGRFLC